MPLNSQSEPPTVCGLAMLGPQFWSGGLLTQENTEADEEEALNHNPYGTLLLSVVLHHGHNSAHILPHSNRLSILEHTRQCMNFMNPQEEAQLFSQQVLKHHSPRCDCLCSNYMTRRIPFGSETLSCPWPPKQWPWCLLFSHELDCSQEKRSAALFKQKIGRWLRWLFKPYWVIKGQSTNWWIIIQLKYQL